jgi:hypothetical protein
VRHIENVVFCEKMDKETYINMLKTLELKPPVIIKPNWEPVYALQRQRFWIGLLKL